jgi:transposase
LTTKIHALVEGLGNLARFCLTEGQAHDITQADRLLSDIETDAVVADKAFDSDALVHTITDSGAKAVIPPRSNRNDPREFDVHQYKHRNLIERLFCRIKHFRRVATRYDKLAQHFASFVALVAAFVWLT